MKMSNYREIHRKDSIVILVSGYPRAIHKSVSDWRSTLDEIRTKYQPEKYKSTKAWKKIKAREKAEPAKRRKKKLAAVNEREHKRLGGQNIASTKSFRALQSFGPASEVRYIDPTKYEPH